MAIHKLVLFYCFTPISDPAAVRLWQRELGRRLGLKGRIIVSPHGINGTVGGEVSAVKQYVRGTREYPQFAKIDVTWSAASGTEFPRLSVKTRDELVTFGAADTLVVDESGVVGAGQHLSPEDLHRLVDERGHEVVFFDGRNRFEAEIGRFRDAVIPEVSTTRDFVAELDSGRYDALNERPVVTYCTGGIRCEVLSSLMVERGFREVYQLEGGVLRYGEAYGDEGLWEGSLYVFDDRMRVTFSSETVTLGRCEICARPADDYRDCVAAQCKGRALLCKVDSSDPLCVAHR
jgi:UPF0176 protein